MVQLLALLLITGIFKNWIPFSNKTVKNLQKKLRKKYDISLSWEKLRLTWRGEVVGSHVEFELRKKGVKGCVANLHIRIRPWQAFAKKNIISVYSQDGDLTFENPTGKMADFTSQNTGAVRNQAQRYKSLIATFRRIAKRLKFDIQLRNITISKKSHPNFDIQINDAHVNDTLIYANTNIKVHNYLFDIVMNGDFKNDNLSNHCQLELEVIERPRSCPTLPSGTISGNFSLCSSIEFKELGDFAFDLTILGKDLIYGRAVVEDQTKHEIKIVLSGSLDAAELRIDESKALIEIDEICLKYHFKHMFNSENKLEIGCSLMSTEVENILRTIPKFLNEPLYSLRYSGRFSFSFKLEIVLSPQLGYKFDFIPQGDVKVVEWGSNGLNYLQDKLTQRIRSDKTADGESGEDRHYLSTMIEDLPNVLKFAVVFSEDRNFFKHQGFDFPMMGFALVTNLKNRKFSRGASTITMQLVKNLFLYQDKNVLRKIEEAFLTWLIESEIGLQKDLILQLYLNTIQFGPNVFGIEQASDFYFSASPANLSIAQCLILSYVIPRPLLFVQALNNGSIILIENLERHLRRLGDEMLKNGLITQAEYLEIFNDVTFSNKMGMLSFENKYAALHPTLSDIFIKAAKIWEGRYGNGLRPGISRVYRSSGLQFGDGVTEQSENIQQRQVNSGAMNHGYAFEILFIDQFGVVKEQTELFEKFAHIIAEINSEKIIHWGSSDISRLNKSYFEMSI